MNLTIRDVEAASNKCAVHDQSPDHVLSPNAVALAEIYGYMIGNKLVEIELSALLKIEGFNESHRSAIDKFYCSTESLTNQG